MSPTDLSEDALAPSVWGPGDPHKTYDDLNAEAPEGTFPVDPAVAERAAATDEIARLKAELAAANADKVPPLSVVDADTAPPSL